MPDEDMKDFASFGDVTDEMPGTLAIASPHRLPQDLRARVLRAVEARAGRAGRFSIGAVPLGTWARPVGMAAVLALVIGLAIWNLQLQMVLADERTLLQQLRDNARESVIFEVVDSPGSQRISLRAVGAQRPGEDPPYGKLYANANQTQVVFMGGRLPAADANQEYRLYLTDRSGRTANAGVLRVDATGFGYLIYDTGVRGPAVGLARLYLQPRSASDLEGTLVLLFESR